MRAARTKEGTYHRRKRFAGRAEGKRQARAKTRVHIADALPRGEDGALYALEDTIRDRRVDGEDEAGFEAEPQAGDALLAYDLPRDPKERAVVPFLIVITVGQALAFAFGRTELLSRGDDRDGDREDLRERAGDCAESELGNGREFCGRGAGWAPRGEALQIRRADEGVEEEIGVFCCERVGFGLEGGKGKGGEN